MVTAATLDWPEGARVLGLYAGGSTLNPWRQRLCWIEHDLPGEPGHVSLRPVALVPPGLVIPETFDLPAVPDPRGGYRLVGSVELEQGGWGA